MNTLSNEKQHEYGYRQFIQSSNTTEKWELTLNHLWVAHRNRHALFSAIDTVIFKYYIIPVIIYLDNFKKVAIGKMAEMPTVTFLCVTHQEAKIPPNQSWTHLSLSNSADQRLESAFLGYLLRRRVLSIETLTMKANDSMIVAVNWLNRIHAQVKK